MYRNHTTLILSSACLVLEKPLWGLYNIKMLTFSQGECLVYLKDMMTHFESLPIHSA